MTQARSAPSAGDAPAEVPVGDELSRCPRCDAARGFHVAFRRRDDGIGVVLVCPSCGFRFTVGPWRAAAPPGRPFDPSVDGGP